MKDKHCTDFVFMPVKGGGDTGPPMATGGEPAVHGGVAAGGSSEVKSKIVVVGDCGCGKTSLIHRYVNSAFQDTYTPTGFDTYSGVYNVSDTYTINMSIWDTSGDAGYDRVRPLSYSDADLVIICFSISSLQSMENVVSKWHPEVRENCPSQPVMLVGCKADARADAKHLPPTAPRPILVSYDQGLKTAKHIGALVYSETSSKTSQRSVNDVMEVAALSSAGATGTGAVGGAGGVGGGDGSGSIDRRHRSILRRKRFSGLNEAKVHLRKEAAKSCVLM
ncbi:ras-related protein Rac1-like [Babylonia areolata]|uniref:ras-related protein Rac1-like n=1 Tax=Babylonia areolata TaxID=304850 RepID=UPI003FD09293